MFWVAVVYAISTPFAIWIEVATDRGDSFDERLRRKASDGLKSVAWMFDSGFATWHMAWAILTGPVVVSFCAIALVLVVPIALIADYGFGVELFKDDKPTPDSSTDTPSVG